VVAIWVLASCATTQRTLFAPPAIPGASFIGSEECAQCHGELDSRIATGADAPHFPFKPNIEKGYLKAQKGITSQFKGSAHGAIQIRGDNPLNVGCESCHGPGSKHSEAGGGVGNIINPKKSPEICFQCHLEKQGQFHLPTHHQVLEGRVNCSDCHPPHQGVALRMTGPTLSAESQTCIKCHPRQRGPFVFEHEALREGCVTCHDPHGSVNSKLLKQRNANLCLKCHFQQRSGSDILIGGLKHTDLLYRGTCWSAGCHEAVHGSQVNRSLRF